MYNLEMLRIMERSLEALEEGFVVSAAFKLRDAINQAKADLDAQAPDIPDDEKEAIIKAANEWDEMHESRESWLCPIHGDLGGGNFCRRC